jgi:hypothetical protein
MKKYFLGIFAVAVALGMSAFSTSHQPKKLGTQYWFVYNGGGETDPSHFSYDPNQTQACFNSTSDLCQVLADPSNPSDPQHSTPILSTATIEAKRN